MPPIRAISLHLGRESSPSRPWRGSGWGKARQRHARPYSTNPPRGDPARLPRPFPPMPSTSCQPPNPGPGEARRRTAWGARLFADIVSNFPPSTPPAERRLVRCVFTVFRMSDRMLEHMEDTDVWELALAYERLKAIATDAVGAGVDGCYVRTLMALAFVAARDVLEAASGYVDPNEMIRAEADLGQETP